MIRILSLFLVLGCLSANAADWITASIHVSTNAPLGNTNSVTINGDTRTFTNSVTGSPATLVQQTNSVFYTATNLLNHLTSYKVNPGYYLSQTSSTNVTIRGLVGGPMVVTLAGWWGNVTYSTQTVQTPTYVVRVPVSNEAATNRVIIANGLVDAASDYATSLFDTNAVSLGNFLSKGASALQTVTAPVSLNQLTNSTNKGTIYGGTYQGATVVSAPSISGVVSALTNGYATNLIAENLTVTNLNSPGLGSLSQKLGANTSADGIQSLSLGQGTTANGDYSTAVGAASSAIGIADYAFGVGAEASGGSSIAGGSGAATGATNAATFGARSVSVYQNSTAIGADSATTKSNQVMLGTSERFVTVPGVLEAASQTNSVIRGTNVLNGRIDLTAGTHTSLANGYNSGVVVGTNAYRQFSGPSGAYTNAGFAAPGGPQFAILQFDNPGLSFTLLNESGLDATAANRILTGTGALLNSTNNPVLAQLIYDTAASRWRVISFR